MHIVSLRTMAILFAASCALMSAHVTAFAQSADASKMLAAEEHLDDFVHYALTANVELAEANANWLLQNIDNDEDLAKLMNNSRVTPKRFARAMLWAGEVPGFEEIAGKLASRIEAGRLALSRDQARVEDSISKLDGTRRDQMLARSRLLAAGEYAVPALVREMTTGQNEERRWAAAQLLREIGREAVTPLTVALPNVAPEHQRRISQILGASGYNHAGPALLELSLDESAPAFVRESAGKAYRQLGGNPALDQPGTLHVILGRQYFDNAEHLFASPWDATHNIWGWDDFAGLTTTAVPADAFGPIMSMRCAASALQYDPRDRAAISQFIASNLRRENVIDNMSGDWDDPIFGDLAYSPQFYATVHGSGAGQDVLAMAIDSRDTPLVRDALSALSRTTGSGNLFNEYLDRQPLLDAMQYPDRRVQYETALILAHALPQSPFAGAYRVVPTLASAVRTGGDEYAVVIAETPEDQRAAANRLEAMGFNVVGMGTSADELVDSISRAAGIDLAVIRTTSMETDSADLAELRRNPKTSATPVMLVVQAGDMPAFKNTYRADSMVGVSRAGITENAFAAATEALMQKGAGGRLTKVDAEIYAMESLGALREIALARPGAYAIGDAESSLIESLRTRTGGTRLLVAEILSLIESERSQQALLDAALAEDVGPDRIPLLDHSAASIRRYGNRSHRRHVEELRYLIDNSSGDVADATARVHGAMSLPPEESTTIVIPSD
ncbi:MAG: HEAT repeat domain-containing protein [Phycisphaerales bacterium]|nr:HEAT repeat domain-containing protein [Phycisphaerales bacterium]